MEISIPYVGARVRGFNERDKNTRYFYIVAVVRKKKATIIRLVEKGNVIIEPSELRKVITEYFKEIYRQADLPKVCLSADGFNTLSKEEGVELEEILSKEDSRRVVWS